MSRATRSAPLIVLSLAALVVPMVDAAAADGTAHVPLVVPVVDVAQYIRRSGAFVTLESTKLVNLGFLEKLNDSADGRRVLLKQRTAKC